MPASDLDVGGLNEPDASVLLITIGRERARLLTPALFGASVLYAVGMSAFGLIHSAQEVAFMIAALAVLGSLMILGIQRQIPQRWVHQASAVTLWCPMATTCFLLYTAHNQVFASLLIIQIACAGVLLETRLVAATLIGVSALAIPGLWLSHAPYLALSVSAVITAAVFAALIHWLMRRALLAEAATSRRLAQRVAELEQSQAARALLQDQLLHSQRLEAVGTLAAGVAHDMNNVLASISNFAALVLEHTTAAEPRADLHQVIEQAQRGASLTGSLLAFSRRGQYHRTIIRIDDVIAEVMPLITRTLPKSIEIRQQIDVADACLNGDPVHLGQMLVNFCLNSSDAMDGKGAISISARVVDLTSHVMLPPGRYVQLSVTDEGKGMDAATRTRVFEPFFTTKSLGHGTGLGLSMVWGIVHAHDGAVEVESEPGRGTTFTVQLPLSSTTLVPTPSALVVRDSSTPLHAAGTVLVVDDEQGVRDTTKRLLGRMGLTAFTAGDGVEALRIYAEHAKTISLVILDMGMPTMGGGECFWKLRETSQVPVLIATGYAIDSAVQPLVAAGAHFLEKPYASEDLKREVIRILTGSARYDVA